MIFLFRPDFLFIWVCYPTSDKKVSGRTLRATCSPGIKSRLLNNTASGCGRASLGRKHFGLSILFQSSVSDYFLFQIWTLHTPPQHHLPCLRGECSQDVMLPFGHTETRQEVILFPHHAHSTVECSQHSLTAKRDLCLIWAVRSQGKQRM